MKKLKPYFLSFLCTLVLVVGSCKEKFDCIAHEIDLRGEWQLVKEVVYEDDILVNTIDLAGSSASWDCETVTFVSGSTTQEYEYTIADIETNGSRNYFQSNFEDNYTSTMRVDGNTAILTIHQSGSVIITNVTEMVR